MRITETATYPLFLLLLLTVASVWSNGTQPAAPVQGTAISAPVQQAFTCANRAEAISSTDTNHDTPASVQGSHEHLPIPVNASVASSCSSPVPMVPGGLQWTTGLSAADVLLAPADMPLPSQPFAFQEPDPPRRG